MKRLSLLRKLAVIIPAAILLTASASIQEGGAQSGYPSRVTTDALTMTGLTAKPVGIATEVLTMTGSSPKIIKVTSDTLTMTGKSFQPLRVFTETLTMKGKR